ncbi:peptide transporter PTR2-A [Eremomyces bilateralis CBS 781.70]|uniref:Peptide transporter PTR2-A n=1 Tax=Eremomyces bilateralis CBS 781.70 TaxID=1392243 RepID=A0A6G1GDE1_9PEZI|nr:peptide transporter PTR2-A [Eremomyces bilateralis CBS 781.70]KAF1816032.1 peptide transporter PTR2-A [Eremomyces bilateralis CBS 781.70]
MQHPKVEDDDSDAELDLEVDELLNRDRSSNDVPSDGEFGIDGREPSDLEKRTLRRVPDALPKSAFLVAIVELCERFAYYGLSGPFQNYISNKYNDPNGNPGALGLGQTSATGILNFFQFWCYCTPIVGAIVADQYLGKYLTIVYFSIIYMIGIVVLFFTSLPYAIEHGIALPGLIASMIVIGLGTGGIKANVAPLIAEQYRGTRAYVKTRNNGERVIVDPATTIQRIYMVFYLCINIGSLSATLTTTLEKHVGFWSAYLLPLIAFGIGFVILIGGKKKYVVRPPQGSVIVHCGKAIWIALRNGGDINAAKPSHQRNVGKGYNTPWDDIFIEELKRAFIACKVFLVYPVYWCVFSQLLTNFVSQAGQMELHGIPNDIMQNLDPLALVIIIPILDRVGYPLLRRCGFPMLPMTRIFLGFLLGSLAMAYAAFVQHQIYAAPPCYGAPLKCDAARQPDGSILHNKVHVALQTPAYLILALSEVFASVTGLEFAYTKAPASMKSFIMSLFLLTSAGGSLLGALVSPFANDPNLVGLYIGIGTVCFISGLVFWALFRKYNDAEESLNDLDHIIDKVAVVRGVPELAVPLQSLRNKYEGSS